MCGNTVIASIYFEPFEVPLHSLINQRKEKQMGRLTEAELITIVKAMVNAMELLKKKGSKHLNLGVDTIFFVDTLYKTYHPDILRPVGGDNITKYLNKKKNYAAPELINELTRRVGDAKKESQHVKPDPFLADLYSLALTITEVACLKMEAAFTTREGAVHKELIQSKLSEMAEFYSEGFVDLIIRMLSIDPKNRPSCTETLQILSRLENPNVLQDELHNERTGHIRNDSLDRAQVRISQQSHQSHLSNGFGPRPNQNDQFASGNDRFRSQERLNPSMANTESVGVIRSSQNHQTFDSSSQQQYWGSQGHANSLNHRIDVLSSLGNSRLGRQGSRTELGEPERVDRLQSRGVSQTRRPNLREHSPIVNNLPPRNPAAVNGAGSAPRAGSRPRANSRSRNDPSKSPLLRVYGSQQELETQPATTREDQQQNPNIAVNLSQVFTQMPASQTDQPNLNPQGAFKSEQAHQYSHHAQPAIQHASLKEGQDPQTILRLSNWTFPTQPQGSTHQSANAGLNSQADQRRVSQATSGILGSPISSRVARNDSNSNILPRGNVNFVPDLQSLPTTQMYSAERTLHSNPYPQVIGVAPPQPWGLSYAHEAVFTPNYQPMTQQVATGLPYHSQGISLHSASSSAPVSQHHVIGVSPIQTYTPFVQTTPDISRAEKNLQMIRGSSPMVQDHNKSPHPAASRSASRVVKVTRYSYDQNGNRKLIGEEMVEQPIISQDPQASVQQVYTPRLPGTPVSSQIPPKSPQIVHLQHGQPNTPVTSDFQIKQENPSYVRGTEVFGGRILQNSQLDSNPQFARPTEANKQGLRSSQGSVYAAPTTPSAAAGSNQRLSRTTTVSNSQPQSITGSQLALPPKPNQSSGTDRSNPPNLVQKIYSKEADGNTYELKTFSDPLGGTRVEKRLAIDSKGQLCGIFKETGIDLNDVFYADPSQNSNQPKEPVPAGKPDSQRKDLGAEQKPAGAAKTLDANSHDDRQANPLGYTNSFNSKSNQQGNLAAPDSTHKDPGSVFTFKQQFDGSHQKAMLQNRANLGSVARNLQEKENIPAGFGSVSQSPAAPGQKLFAAETEPQDKANWNGKPNSLTESNSPMKVRESQGGQDPTTPTNRSAKTGMKDSNSQVAEGLRGKTIKVRYKEYNGKTYPIGVHGDNLTKDEKEWLLQRVLEKEGFTIEEIEALEGGPLTDLEDGSEYRLTAEKSSDALAGNQLSNQKVSGFNGTGGKSKTSFVMSEEKPNSSADLQQYQKNIPGNTGKFGANSGTNSSSQLNQFQQNDQSRQQLNLMASNQNSNANSSAQLGGLPPKPKGHGLSRDLPNQVINEAEDEEMVSQTSSAFPSQRRVVHSGQKIDLTQPPTDEIWFRTKEQRVLEDAEQQARNIDMSKSSKKGVPQHIRAEQEQYPAANEDVNIRFDYGSGKGYKPRAEEFESNERDTNGYDATDIDVLLRHNEDLLSRIKMDMKNIGESFVSATDMGNSRLRNNLSALAHGARASDFDSKDMMNRSPIALQEFESFKTKTQDDKYYQHDKGYPLKSPQMPNNYEDSPEAKWSRHRKRVDELWEGTGQG